MAREDAHYLAIAGVLRERIKDGTYTLRTNLPGLVDLMKEFEASRALVDRAGGALEAEGLAWAVPHKGTVVLCRMTRQRPRGNIVKHLRPRPGADHDRHHAASPAWPVIPDWADSATAFS